MLLRRRSIHVGSLGAYLSERSVLHPRFRVFVKERQGVVCDDRLFEKSLPGSSDGFSYISLPLYNEVRLRSGEREHALGVGELLGDVVSRPRSMRQEGSQATLVVEWQEGSLGTRALEGAVGRVSKRTIERLRGAAAGLASAELTVPEASVYVAEIVRTLRAEGLPFDPVEAPDLVEEVPETVLQVGEAISRALTALDKRPGHIDLQDDLGWSRSRLHRNLTAYQEHVGIGRRAGWRRGLYLYRLQLGSALMTSPNATTEGVARLLGYSSPRAFCYAFANAGLPSPGAVMERLRQLG